MIKIVKNTIVVGDIVIITDTDNEGEVLAIEDQPNKFDYMCKHAYVMFEDNSDWIELTNLELVDG